ncbi:MAG: TolC family protein, partial [Pseudomonadota bacterium]|nr:TolC family protein [Pseudomonadota bacterium]
MICPAPLSYANASAERRLLGSQPALMAIMLVTVLGACAVGPDYVPPRPPLPEKWVSTTEAVTDEQAIDQAWWQNFHDPILDQLIAKGINANPDLMIAEARIAEARATRASADAGLLPTGNLAFNANRQANRLAFPSSGPSGLGNLLKKPFNTFQTGFDASWELDLFGGHRREIESANAGLEAAEAARDGVKVSLMAEIARTYLDIRQYQAQLAIVTSTVATYQNTGTI